MNARQTISILALLCALPLLQAAEPAYAQNKGAAAGRDAGPLSGTWAGYWLSPEGFFYSATLRFETPGSALEGSIDWTLEVSPRKEEEAKIGLTGVEYVRGEFDPDLGILTLEGYEKDDPNGILGLDRYRLFLAENGTVIGGITWNHGAWNGLFMVERAPQ